MFNLVVLPREAIRPFSVAVALRAVDVLLFMSRCAVSDHISFAGELSGRIPIPKLATLLEVDGKKAIGKAQEPGGG